MRYDGAWEYGYYEGNASVQEQYTGVAAANDDSFVIAGGYRNTDTTNQWQYLFWTRFDSTGVPTNRYEFGEAWNTM